MSHNFTSNTAKTGTNNSNVPGMQFYNPIKDNPHSLINQHSQSSNTLNNGSLLNKYQSSKQYHFKTPSSLNDIKSNNQTKLPTSNSSTFLKSINDHTGSNKYIPGNSANTISSSTIMNKTINNITNSSTTSSFISSNHNKSLNSEMIKSSIQDMNSRKFKKDDFNFKDNKIKPFQTTPKRPRLSQPMNGNLDQKLQQNNLNNNFTNTQSPPAFLKDKQKQKQGGFHKFKPYQSPTLEKFQSPTLEKFDKQMNFSHKSPNTMLSPFRGVENKTGGQQGSFGKKSYGNKNTKKITMNDFQKIKQLGAGKYGKVFLARQKASGFICAVKMIQKQLLKDEQIVEQFIRQLKIQIFLNHPHIIKMYGYFDDQTNIYIILEVGTGGQLYHQLKRSQPMPQSKVASYIKQVCEAINQIHSLRIIHRDIKPQNIVLHENVVKLCDFGWSVHQDNKMRTTFCGTPLYVCPQILRGKQYDQKIDIWSLGIMMYQMLVGQNPFKITKQQQLIKIVKDKIQIPSYVFVSGQARDFLDKCLQKNPAQRVNIRELLNHEFFKKYPDKAQKKVSL